MDYYATAKEWFAYAQRLRRDFHRHPELGFREVRTAGIVADELHQLGMEVIRGVAETGVVGMLQGEQPGPVVMLRFDMDALPIQEETGAPYASQNAGVMHACGHDGHTAIGLTVARVLHALQPTLRGSVKFVFQPAEEGLGGAERMVAEGVLANPKPDYVLGLHLWNQRPVGWIGVAPGATMAAAEKFKVRIFGKGGHGAVPHLAIDPVLASAHLITALQSIVSRNVDPLETAVVSVTMMRSGEAFNVIPEEALLEGTIRTFSEEVRQSVLERFTSLAQSIAQSFSCRAEVEVQPLTPAVVNEPSVSKKVQQAITQALPTIDLATSYRTMGSEDMAFFLKEVPGCFFFVGSADAQHGLDAPHHHPRFDFGEDALVYAVAAMTAATIALLGDG